MSQSPAPRRRIPHKSDKPAENRSGCLIWGAVLGVVVGGMFAAYGLEPILRHYYGETKVAVGQAYEGDAKTIRIEAVDGEATRHITRIVLSVTTNKTWHPTPDLFSIEYAGVEDWQEAQTLLLGPNDEPLSGGLPLGETVRLTIEIPRPEGSTGAPEYLHISDPRVRIELPR